jgi:hypothetical protein
VQAEEADHSFHVPARSGRTNADVLDALLDRTATWMQDVIRGGGGAREGARASVRR